MKKEIFKNIIKESMRELFKEPEFLEGLKKDMEFKENTIQNNPENDLIRKQLREQFSNVLQETKASFNTSSFTGDFKPNPSSNGDLSSGEVNLDTILRIMNK